MQPLPISICPREPEMHPLPVNRALASGMQPLPISPRESEVQLFPVEQTTAAAAQSLPISIERQWSQRAAARLQALQWGEDHPDYDKNVKRARWTHEEVSYIFEWCRKTMVIHPHLTMKASHCLEYMRNDPAAVRTFHEIHTLDSARLRNGFKKLEDRKCELVTHDDYGRVMSWLEAN